MATELEVSRAWFAYLADARRGYLDRLATLPAPELGRDRGASHPSMLDIFAHSQGALWYWLSSFAPADFPPPDREPSEPPTLAELAEFETYLQDRIRPFLARLAESDLDRTVHRTKGRGSPHDCEIPLRDVLWHLVEEELQHLGELNALLWQLDVDAPVRSWIGWSHDVGRIRHPPA